MNKKYMILILGMLFITLITFVIAQSLINTSKTIDKTRLSLIKSTNNLSSVQVQISDINCLNNKCITHAYLENVINKEIGINKFKCVLKDKRERCIKRIEKTSAELRAEIDNIILNELDNYADKLIKEEVKTGGILEIK